MYNILQEGNTPLHIAARDGFTESLFILVAHGADINAKYDVRICPALCMSVCLSVVCRFVCMSAYLSLYVRITPQYTYIYSVCHSYPLPKYFFPSQETKSHTFDRKTMDTRTVNCPVPNHSYFKVDSNYSLRGNKMLALLLQSTILPRNNIDKFVSHEFCYESYNVFEVDCQFSRFLVILLVSNHFCNSKRQYLLIVL